MFYMYEDWRTKQQEYREDRRAAEIAQLLKGAGLRQKGQPFRQILKLLQSLTSLLPRPGNQVERLGPENDMTQQPKAA